MNKTIFVIALVAILNVFFSVVAQTREVTKVAKGYVKTKDINMYYEIKGEGAPIILLHGAYMTMEGMMREYATELSKTRKVILTEFQGHGRTPDVKTKDITYEGLADDIAALLK